MGSQFQNNLVLVEKYDNKVAKVTLNNPPLNLVTLPLARELRDTLKKLGEDDSVRCVVLTGCTNRALSVGSDVKEFPTVWDDVVDKKLKNENETFNMLEMMPKPVIAAIEGVVCGGGMEMSMACDIRIMSDESKAAFPEINLGVFPASGGSFRLPKLVGPAKAVELMYLGEFISAQECLRIGLVNQVVPAGTVLDTAMEMAAKIAAKPAQAVKIIKKSVREMSLKTTEGCFWDNLHFSEEVFKTPDCAEGVSAFLEKRKPNFLG